MVNKSDDPPLNPYEAPQSQELPTAKSVEIPVALIALVSPPREVRRWMKAAIILYFASFFVPFAPWVWLPKQDWHIGMGFFLFYIGAISSWLPCAGFPSWWANVTFWIAWRSLNRKKLDRASTSALLGLLIAPLTATVFYFTARPPSPYSDGDDFPVPLESILTSAPHLCWLAAMLLMFVATFKKAWETPSSASLGSPE